MAGHLQDERAIQTFFGLFDRPVHVAELLWYQSAFSFEDAFLIDEVLAGQREFHAEFHHQYRDAVRKWRRAQRVAGWLQLFPWIQGVGVGNTLAYLNVRPESDIDLFVVSAPGRLWLTRFMVTGLLRVLRWRPHEGQRDPVCPSFFVTSDVKSFASIAIDNDVYLQLWLATVVVLWEDGNIFGPIFARNTWAVTRSHSQKLLVLSPWKRCVRFVFSIFSWNWVDYVVERVQRVIIPDVLLQRAAESGSEVVLSTTMLKFHYEDRREQYRDAFIRTYGQGK